MQPWWRDDVCAALFLEEEGEPERELGAVWRFQRRCGALEGSVSICDVS